VSGITRETGDNGRRKCIWGMAKASRCFYATTLDMDQLDLTDWCFSLDGKSRPSSFPPHMLMAPSTTITTDVVLSSLRAFTDELRNSDIFSHSQHLESNLEQNSQCLQSHCLQSHSPILVPSPLLPLALHNRPPSPPNRSHPPIEPSSSATDSPSPPSTLSSPFLPPHHPTRSSLPPATPQNSPPFPSALPSALYSAT
jgi:hypothetical protein